MALLCRQVLYRCKSNMINVSCNLEGSRHEIFLSNWLKSSQLCQNINRINIIKLFTIIRIIVYSYKYLTKPVFLPLKV